jgi:hypothetical protein
MNTEAMITSAFARFHAITILQAERYADGIQARREGRGLPESRAITAEDAWFRAGWHDEDMRGAV